MPTDSPFSDRLALVPAIAQDAATGDVLMIAYMNEEAWEKTLETGRVHYYSRSRDRLWQKGEQSGHVQELIEMRLDCDGDALLLKVRQRGDAACHAGYRSCFYRRWEDDTWKISEQRVFDPNKAYGE